MSGSGKGPLGRRHAFDGTKAVLVVDEFHINGNELDLLEDGRVMLHTGEEARFINFSLSVSIPELKGSYFLYVLEDDTNVFVSCSADRALCRFFKDPVAELPAEARLLLRKARPKGFDVV